MIDPAALGRSRPSNPSLSASPTRPGAARPSSAILALIGPACRPDVLVRALRVLRKNPPEPAASVRPLQRTLLAGIERRDPSDWWALAECAETLAAVAAGHEAAARALDEALAATLAQRERAGEAADRLADAIVRALATVGAPARLAVPILTALVRDPALGGCAQATLGELDVTAPTDLATVCVMDVEAIGAVEIDETRRRARPLSREEVGEIGAARRRALRHTRHKPGALPDAIVRAIGTALSKSVARQSEEERADLEFELGVLWGDQVVRTVGWEWVELCWETWSAPAIVSPDRAHACFPMRLIADAIETGRTALVEQVFTRVRRGDLPEAPAGDLVVIG